MGGSFSQWLSVSTKQLFLNDIPLQNNGLGFFSPLILVSSKCGVLIILKEPLNSDLFFWCFSCLIASSLYLPANIRKMQDRGSSRENLPCLKINKDMSYNCNCGISYKCTGGMDVEPQNSGVWKVGLFDFSLFAVVHSVIKITKQTIFWCQFSSSALLVLLNFLFGV